VETLPQGDPIFRHIGQKGSKMGLQSEGNKYIVKQLWIRFGFGVCWSKFGSIFEVFVECLCLCYNEISFVCPMGSRRHHFEVIWFTCLCSAAHMAIVVLYWISNGFESWIGFRPNKIQTL